LGESAGWDLSRVDSNLLDQIVVVWRTEVVTVSWWDSLESIDIVAAVFYPEREDTVTHYEVPAGR
jgi:hypothetical protein